MATKKQIKEWTNAGADYAGDLVCWNSARIEKAFAAGTLDTIEGELANEGSDAAVDLAGGSEVAADYIFDGCRKALRVRFAALRVRFAKSATI